MDEGVATVARKSEHSRRWHKSEDLRRDIVDFTIPQPDKDEIGSQSRKTSFDVEPRSQASDQAYADTIGNQHQDQVA